MYYKKHRFGVSIVEFEQLNVRWEVTYKVFCNPKLIPRKNQAVKTLRHTCDLYQCNNIIIQKINKKEQTGVTI